jgi:DNA (cytosine-5)-methyltransferase 1
MKINAAELCAGYGGLTLGLAAAGLPVNLAWYAENDSAASTVMAAHHPGVPNLGDITAVDWTRAEPVDLLCAGYPCTDLSNAGKRAGIEGVHSGIWRDVAAAVRDLRPRHVLLENVAAHLARGFGRVLGDLAAIGYDARWLCVRASDVGAAHRRDRVFIWAVPADAESVGHGHTWTARQPRIPAVPVAGAATGTGVDLLPTPTARDGDGRGEGDAPYWQKRAAEGRTNGLPLGAALALLPTPRATDGTKGGPNQRGTSGDLMLPSAVQPYRWGRYGPAIARWERATGCPAPDPTEVGTRGAQRLSPRFVEWLMGLPAGHVTDHAPRNAALRILGNGVVPQQAARAVRELLAGAA